MTLVARPTLDAGSGVADLELGAPLPALCSVPALGVRCLVRVGARPVAMVDLAGPADRIEAEALADALWAHAADAIDAACRESGVDPPAHPAPGGLDLPAAADPDEVAADVTVAIATRDRPDTLERCLESLLAARPAPGAIVVVDNAPSDDRTERLLAERHGDDPRIRYALEPRPGLGRAHNAALPLITTPYVAFTDDDVVVDRHWVGALRRAFDATGDVACVTGLIAPAELRTVEQWWIEHSTGFGKGFARRVRTLRDRRGEGPLFPYDAGTLGSGANMAFAMDALGEIGGFDPALGTGTVALGGDDLAALHQVVAAGHDLVYEPAAIVFHRHHDDLAALERQARGYGAGLTAYLTSVVAHRPGAAWDIARRAVPGLARVVHPSSPLNDRRSPDFPRALVRRERLGMVSGPWRYARQRWRDARFGRSVGR